MAGKYKYRVTGPRGGKYLTTTRREAEKLTRNGGTIRALGQKKASKVKNPDRPTRGAFSETGLAAGWMQSDAEAIDEAWGNNDWGELHRMGVISNRDMATIKRLMAKEAAGRMMTEGEDEVMGMIGAKVRRAVDHYRAEARDFRRHSNRNPGIEILWGEVGTLVRFKDLKVGDRFRVPHSSALLEKVGDSGYIYIPMEAGDQVRDWHLPLKEVIRVDGRRRNPAADKKWHGFGPGSLESVKWKWRKHRGVDEGWTGSSQIEYYGSYTVHGQFGETDVGVSGTINFPSAPHRVSEDEIFDAITESIGHTLSEGGWEPDWWFEGGGDFDPSDVTWYYDAFYDDEDPEAVVTIYTQTPHANEVKDEVQSVAGSMLEQDGDMVYAVVMTHDLRAAVEELVGHGYAVDEEY